MRPIVRGKANASVGFGVKVAIGVVNGFVTVEHLAWDAYNESTTLIDSIEKYRRDTGYYPKQILADKIYRTGENLQYCKGHGIRMNGPKLGRRPKCLKVYAAQCRLEREESGERNEVEGEFGVGKRIYRLDRILTSSIFSYEYRKMTACLFIAFFSNMGKYRIFQKKKRAC